MYSIRILRPSVSSAGGFGLCLFALQMLACAGESASVPSPADVVDGTDTSVDGSGHLPDTSDPDTAPIVVPPAPTDGTRVRFDWTARLTSGEGFYAFPYPSDLRRYDNGAPDLRGLGERSPAPIVANLLSATPEMPGFPTLSVAWFAFDGPVAPQDGQSTFAARTDQPILLMLVEPGHPEQGKLLPVVAQTLAPDVYVDANVLAVGARPGAILDPGVRWAWVVMRSLGDESGQALGVPESMWNLAHGGTSGDADVDTQYAPLVETLARLQISPDQVAAATVFRTADVVAETFALTEALRAAYAPRIENLGLAARGSGWDGYCELHGTITLPQFQAGVPPFDSEGLFVMGDDGLPVLQREETIPVVITLPHGEMPAEGFPLVMYYHGSGGLSTQLVDRGPTPRGGVETVGRGPAWVLAQRGFAAAGSAHPVNPERVPGASGTAYLNFGNLKAFRDTFRQGVIEQRLYLDALLALEIPAAAVAGCTPLQLPSGQTSFRFRAEPVLAMGQSMGGMYTNMVAAVEPRIRAVVPTGAGGFWSYFILETSLLPNTRTLVGALLQTRAPLSFLHPALHTLQTAWEAAEPLVYVPRLAHHPLADHPVRSIYQPVGLGDSYFPPPIFDAISLAYENQQAGDVVWDSMQPVLALGDLDGLAAYPVQRNREAADGTEYTGVVVQYAGDGFSDPHNIFVQLEAVRHQYACFFETFVETGVATVVAPATEGSPCQ